MSDSQIKPSANLSVQGGWGDGPDGFSIQLRGDLLNPSASNFSTRLQLNLFGFAARITETSNSLTLEVGGGMVLAPAPGISGPRTTGFVGAGYKFSSLPDDSGLVVSGSISGSLSDLPFNNRLNLGAGFTVKANTGPSPYQFDKDTGEFPWNFTPYDPRTMRPELERNPYSKFDPSSVSGYTFSGYTGVDTGIDSPSETNAASRSTPQASVLVAPPSSVLASPIAPLVAPAMPSIIAPIPVTPLMPTIPATAFDFSYQPGSAYGSSTLGSREGGGSDNGGLGFSGYHGDSSSGGGLSSGSLGGGSTSTGGKESSSGSSSSYSGSGPGRHPSTPASNPFGSGTRDNQDPHYGDYDISPNSENDDTDQSYGQGYGANISPVLLDISGNGISIVPLTTSSSFVDESGFGYQHRTAWAGDGSGVLVLDADGNGKITNSTEYVFTDWDPSATSDLQVLISTEK